MSTLPPRPRSFRWAAVPLLLAGLLPLLPLASGFADEPPTPATGPGAGKAPAVESVLPAPTEPLKDFLGKSTIVLDLPPAKSTTQLENGEAALNPGVAMWIDINQSFVWPDRILVERSGQKTLVQGNTEIDYSPTVNYIVERTYKNLDRGTINPIRAVQFSLATYARLVREMPGGKLLPDEDPDRLSEQFEARIKELQAQRTALTKPEEIALYNSISAEMVRLRRDSYLLPFRRENPCALVQFNNHEVLDTLFSRGLLVNRNVDALLKGSTTFWVTRAHGLPVKMEVTDNNGHVVIYFGFTEVKVNTGLRPGDLAVNAPSGTPRLLVGADLANKDWEDRMEKELQKQIKARDDITRNRNAPRPRQR